MESEPVPGYPPALVIGGMHRSGSSLTASLLAAAGLDVGEQLLPPSESNPRGHFEDLDFYGLHQKILAANGLSLEGYTCQAAIEIPPALRAEATALVRRRRAAGRPWGWKDPRTVLFLDFWAELLPEARWLFVVRPPEAIVDSLFRRGDTAFACHPPFAVDVCAAYGRRMLEFARGRPGQVAVVELATVVTDPASLIRRVASLLGIDLVTPESTYEAGLLTADQEAHRAKLVRAARPEVAETFAELARLGGSGGAEPSPPLLVEVAGAGLAEWAAGHGLRAALGTREAQELELRRSLAGLTSEFEAEQKTRAEAELQAERLTAEAAAAGGQRYAALDRLRAEPQSKVEAHARARQDWADQHERELAERDRVIAGLELERDGLTAQLDSERGMFEALRADMSDRIEAAASGRNAGLGD